MNGHLEGIRYYPIKIFVRTSVHFYIMCCFLLYYYLYEHLFILVIQSNVSMSPKNPGEGVVSVFNTQSKLMNRNTPRVGNLI